MTTTRDDVARLARVSPAVVSYVLNGGPRPVAVATRQRVLDAIEQLDYRPNALARGLRRAANDVLGLIVPDISNPFFAEVALSVENAAFECGYSLFLGNSMHVAEREAVYLQAFAEHQVAGLCLITDQATTGSAAASSEALRRWSVPLVLLDRLPLHVNASSFAVDNENGAYQATKHLLDHGHHSVTCISGPAGISVAETRVLGWRRAHKEAHRRPGGLLRCQFDRRDAYELATRLLSKPKRPTAIFVQSDEQAVGVIHAAAALSVAVPRDTAIVSFDDTTDSSFTAPALTTIRQPFEEIGKRVVERLLKHIADPTLQPEHGILPVSLMIRNSCGCP